MKLSVRDEKIIWHPYTQHGINKRSIGIVKASGAWLYDEAGRKYLDATSSWWTCTHGHSHPYIASRVSKQIKKLEHVIFAGFTHKPAVDLASGLLKQLPSNQKRIFFSDNGSTAVEVALKMCIQFWYNKGKSKTEFIAFKNAYHGDTFGAMSVSARGAFSAPFAKGLFNVHFIDAPIKGFEKRSLAQMKALLEKRSGRIAGFIFEPIVQGVAGMVMQNADGLDQLIKLCKQRNVFTIADEVFTGFGRTGKFFASDRLKQKPDLFCLSKGLTGGTMALGVTSCTAEIYKGFYSKDRSKTFFHGHSFTANPIACAAAGASLELMNAPRTWRQIRMINQMHKEFGKKLIGAAKYNFRTLGTIMAFDIPSKAVHGYFNTIRDKAVPYFLARGIVLRPLGNIVYVVPPYCITKRELKYIYEVILKFLKHIEKDQ